MTLDERLDAVTRALETVRVPAFGVEYDIHEIIAQALSECNVNYQHEYRLGPRCRIDFLASGIGVEVKHGLVSRRQVIAQIDRYMAFECVEALILVSSRQINLPLSIHGKQVISFGLNRLWGVAIN